MRQTKGLLAVGCWLAGVVSAAAEDVDVGRYFPSSQPPRNERQAAEEGVDWWAPVRPVTGAVGKSWDFVADTSTSAWRATARGTSRAVAPAKAAVASIPTPSVPKLSAPRWSWPSWGSGGQESKRGEPDTVGEWLSMPQPRP